jgi:ribosomal protein L20
MRVTNAPASRKRRKRTLRAAKGFRMRRSKLYRYAADALDHGRVYAYRDRKTRKRNFRALWQIRINAAVRAAGLTYSRFIEGLKAAKSSPTSPPPMPRRSTRSCAWPRTRLKPRRPRHSPSSALVISACSAKVARGGDAALAGSALDSRPASQETGSHISLWLDSSTKSSRCVKRR